MDALIRQHDIKTTTYLHNGFLVDVVELPDMIEVWLGHPDVGVKKLVFGMGRKTILDSSQDFDSIILFNLPHHEQIYTERYLS
jgi:hypothetical protein